MEEILREIGLTDYEARIYLCLLKNGALTGYKIAEKIGLYRQVVYDSLNRLQEKGAINQVKEGKSRVFQATSPEILLSQLEEKTDHFRVLLPQLHELQISSKEPLSVETYKGKQVTRIALQDVANHLKSGGENWCTAVDEHLFLKGNKLVIKQYERDQKRYGFKEKVLIKKGTKGLLSNSTYKEIPEKYFNPNPTQVYGDNVSILMLGNPDHLIIIRSKAVAEAYRKQFLLMWEAAEI